jgi:nickel/cobalt transporter (NicO) family protein
VRSPTRWLAALGGAGLLSIAVAIPALAHPLGNFTINHYSRVELVGNQARVLYVLDLAEIPTFQEKQRIADDSTYLGRQLLTIRGSVALTVDGKPMPLTLVDHSVQFLPGQGGLQTERLEVSLVGASALPPGRHAATYHDNYFQGRLGWKEIVVQASDGAQLANASVPNTSVSQELRKYPQDMLTSPLNVTQASFRFAPGAAVATKSTTVLRTATGSLRLVQDRFAALIAPKDLSLPLLGLSLLFATMLGGLHALSPGHGKAVMAGYLVGTQGSKRHALILGLTITSTHTGGVFALGLVTLYAATLVTPERLYPWLTLLSGVMILVIGATLIFTRMRSAFHSHGHEHEDGHSHGLGKTGLGQRNVVLLGITGGLIPCPAALVVLLSALSLHRVAYGMLLIFAYSVGLAIVLSGIGILFASGTALVSRVRPRVSLRGIGRAASLIPVASAAVVVMAGIALTAQALPSVR